MIIALSGADFSAENIGQVDVRTAPNAATQAILDMYNKTTWTLEQELAIEDFLTFVQGASYITRLVVPIFAPATTILSANLATQIAFYDLISESIISLGAGPAYDNLSEIQANGFSQPNYVQNSNNYLYMSLLGHISSYNDVHLGVYYHKQDNSGGTEILSGVGSTTFNYNATLAKIGYSTGYVQGTYDVNAIYNKGFRLLTWDGTNITGIAANLPFSATVKNTPILTVDANLQLLNRFAANLNTVIGLISVGTAMTSSQVTEYNTAINALMDAIWTD